MEAIIIALAVGFIAGILFALVACYFLSARFS